MKRRHVKAKIWKYSKGFKFPEEEYIDSKKKNIGLAFSGGGNRSASLTIGYLRALHHLNLMKDVKYISGVSGGSWAITPYTYHIDSISDNTFLDEFKEPEELTLDDIKQAQKRSFITTISHTKLLDDLLRHIFNGDKIFSRILADVYLKPYLIDDSSKFFSYNKKSVEAIISREGNEELRVDDFFLSNKNKPFLIVGGIITRSFMSSIHRFPFEMTPLYVGVPPYFKNKGSHGRFDIGGGYVEPFGFDSDSPDNGIEKDDLVSVRIKKKKRIFSLADMMATSGAALAEHLDKWLIDVGFPEYDYWSPRNPQKAKEYDFADGGLMDNSGIMPLLRRKVEKVIVFVNGTSDLVSEDKKTNEKVSSMVKALFVKTDNHWGMKNYDLNVVLKEDDKTGMESYEELRDEFISLNKQNKPAVVKKKYKTLRNKAFDIEAGHEVEVLWVHNAFVKQWYDKIKDTDLQEYINSQRTEKLNFPNYPTFATNNIKIIDLDVEQVHIMAHHASYVINSMKNVFKDFFSK